MSYMSPPRTQAAPARFADSWASIYFDSLRGLAAFFVMFGHWRNIFFLDYPQLGAVARWWALPYMLASAGHQAVIVFFVLSGYFIGGTVLRSLGRGQWEWSDYLLRRAVRLWIVLVPALLLCLLWDKLGIYLGHAPGLYGGRSMDHIVPDITHNLSAGVFFGNLFFLQTIVTPVLGTNGPLWSLANEFWYYLLFPLGLVAFRPRKRWSSRLICGVLCLAIAWFVRGGILLEFPIWLSGVLLFKLPAPSFSPKAAGIIRTAATLAYIPVFFGIGKVHLLSALASDYLLCAITLGYVWLLLSAREPYASQDVFVRLSRESARFSYTLYATHLPFLVLAASLLAGDSRWFPVPAKIFIAIGVLIVAMVYAFGLAHMTEFRTDTVRIGLERALGLAVKPPLLSSDPARDAAAHSRVVTVPPEAR
jgi:peptidoglycan/LPS O-acetylase OafA/YrhL